MKNLHMLDDLDLEFIMEVQDELELVYGKRASEVLLESSFLDRIKEDPEYVYHHDEHYWAGVIQSEFNSKQSLIYCT